MEENESFDPDIEKLPFLRTLARGDYPLLIEQAEDYIEEFPDSPLAYQFLAQGLWRSGQKAEALVALKTAMKADADNEVLLQFFTQSADKPAIDFLTDLKIGSAVPNF